MDTQECAAQMYGDHPVEIGGGQIHKQTLMDVACIVHQMGHRPKRGFAGCDHGRDIRLDRHITADGDSRRSDLGGNSLGCGKPKVVDQDTVAVSGQMQCNRPPNARPCTRYNGGIHATSSCSAIRRARRTLSPIRIA